MALAASWESGLNDGLVLGTSMPHVVVRCDWHPVSPGAWVVVDASADGVEAGEDVNDVVMAFLLL